MHVELRIHGVSGTPADRVIGGPASPDDRFAGEPTTVLRPDGGDGRLLAYRWASRTSGSAASAMWLLLVPYMFLNLAGWALPPASETRHRLSVASVRIAGLFLTLVFALVTANGVIGVGAYQVVRGPMSWAHALTLGVVVSALVMVTLWFATTRADDARNDRPYLRSPHIAIALWGVWATAVTAAAEVSGSANPIGTMWVLPAALAVLTAAASLWRGLEDVTRLFGRVAIGASLVLLASVIARPLETMSELPETLVTLGGLLRGAVLAYAFSGILVTALAWSRSHPDAGPAVGTLMALAGSTGAAVGAGAVVVSGAAFGVNASSAAGPLAEAFAVGTSLVAAVAAFHMWTHLEPGSSPLERLVRTAVSIRDDARPLLMAVPIITLAVGTVALDPIDGALAWMAAVAFGVAVVGLAAVGFRLGYRAVPSFVVVLGGTVIGLVAADVVTLRAVAVGFTLVLPTLAVAARIAGAFRSDDRRRTLAIPWDVGSFFSRRFHPFAPPTYRDVVERDLKMVLTQLRRTHDRVVVSAHSQGSIVAVAALGSMPETDIRLLTHGSPLATLFMRFFPVSFPPEVPSRIAVRPWINLWRPTDPIGGPVRSSVDRRVEDRHLRVHGGYWLGDEPEYAHAVDDLLRTESNR
ncbi:MAG: hypothetical protein WEA76_03750 [Acidimicrobiia bacterium]